MRLFYSRFRVLLFSLAFGLASVWMWNAFAIGSGVVVVNLPEARSDTLVQVFGIERRWMPSGGGSGPHGPYVSLRMISENAAAVTFELSNFLGGPAIFVAGGTKGTGNSIPYFLECLPHGSNRAVVIRQPLRFDGSIKRLDDQKSIEITVPKPEGAGKCWLLVPFDRDAATIAANFASPFDPVDLKDFENRVADYVSCAFINE